MAKKNDFNLIIRWKDGAETYCGNGDVTHFPAPPVEGTTTKKWKGRPITDEERELLGFDDREYPELSPELLALARALGRDAAEADYCKRYGISREEYEAHKWWDRLSESHTSREDL